MPRILLTAEEKRLRLAIARKKWREGHRDKYNESMRPISRRYYNDNRDLERRRALGRYYFKKEAEVFRNILIDA